jgi:putative endonuclease
MEEFVVYILCSKNTIRITLVLLPNLMERFKSHNILGTKGYTIKYRPWEVIFVEFFNSKSEAIKREKKFEIWDWKRIYSKPYIEHLIGG